MIVSVPSGSRKAEIPLPEEPGKGAAVQGLGEDRELTLASSLSREARSLDLQKLLEILWSSNRGPPLKKQYKGLPSVVIKKRIFSQLTRKIKIIDTVSQF